jgi:hypothetical protein
MFQSINNGVNGLLNRLRGQDNGKPEKEEKTNEKPADSQEAGPSEEKVASLSEHIVDEAEMLAQDAEKVMELVGDGSDPSFLKRLMDTYEVVNHRFTNFSKRTDAHLDRLEDKIAGKWSGRALLALGKIAAIPLQFTTDVVMAGIKSVKNKMKADELADLLKGEAGPEKLFELMGIGRTSEESAIIRDLLSDPKTKEAALDSIAKSLGRSSQEALVKKTKFTNYLSLGNGEEPKDAQEARTKLEIIYLKNGINPQDYQACKDFEAKMEKNDPELFASLKSLTSQVEESGKKDQPSKKGPWNFSGQDTSLMQKANIALQSAKNGMLWHLLKDPREIAGLATCTINGEYIHNLGQFDLEDTLKSAKAKDAMMRDLLLLKNKDLFEEPMRRQIESSMQVTGSRTDYLKDKASAGSFTVSSYMKKQLSTMSYLAMRSTAGIATDLFKYSTGLHKESIMASEVANSGLAEDYAKLMSSLTKSEEAADNPANANQSEANDFGFRLMNLDKGGAAIAAKELVDKMLLKNAKQGQKPAAEEIAFLEKMSGFMEYQMQKGRVDMAQVNQVKQLVDRYKMESRSVEHLGQEKLAALQKAGYQVDSYACKKTGNWLKDFFIKDEKHAAFVNRNSGNIIFDYVGYQADRLASLGSHQGVEFGGAISLEHHLLEQIGGATTAAVSGLPMIGQEMNDFYSTAKAMTDTATKTMSFDFLTGQQLGKPQAADRAAAPEASQIEALKNGLGEAELVKNISAAINGEAMVKQINAAREQNAQMSEMMVKEVGKFVQEQRLPLLAMALAGGGIMTLIKNPNVLKNLGKAGFEALQGSGAMKLASNELFKKAVLAGGVAGTTLAATEVFGGMESQAAKTEVRPGQGVTYVNFKDIAANPTIGETKYGDLSVKSERQYRDEFIAAESSTGEATFESVAGKNDAGVKVFKNSTTAKFENVSGHKNQKTEQTPVGVEVATAAKAEQKSEHDKDYEIDGRAEAYELKLGEDGVPAELERVFTSLAINKLQLNEKEAGKENDKVTVRDASRALNMGANLVKLAEKDGKGKVAGIEAAKFKEVCTYDAKTGKLDIKDRAGFDEVLNRLETKANENWDNGKLKTGAAEWIGNIKQATWLDIAKGKGLNEGFVAVDENGKEIGDRFGMIRGHDGLEKEDIEKFKKYEHKVAKKDKVVAPAENIAPAIDQKPEEKKVETAEVKNIDDSIVEMSEEEFKVLEEMKDDEAKAATDEIREAVDADRTASTSVNIDKIKEMKVSDVLAPDGKDRISSKLKGPYDEESRSNQNTEKQAEETIKLAQKASEYLDPDEGEKMDSYTKRYQEQVTIRAIEQSHTLAIDATKVPLKDQVKVLRSYGKVFEQVKDHDQKINLMKVLGNPLDKEALLKFTHFDKLGKTNPDYKDVRAEKISSTGDLEITFVTKEYMINADFVITKAGKMYVDGLGYNNWGDKSKPKDVTDTNLGEGLKFVYEKGVGENRKINDEEFAVRTASAEVNATDKLAAVAAPAAKAGGSMPEASQAEGAKNIPKPNARESKAAPSDRQVYQESGTGIDTQRSEKIDGKWTKVAMPELTKEDIAVAEKTRTAILKNLVLKDDGTAAIKGNMILKKISVDDLQKCADYNKVLIPKQISINHPNYDKYPTAAQKQFVFNQDVDRWKTRAIKALSREFLSGIKFKD